MADRKKAEQNYSQCDSPREHRDHLCHLMERGQTEEIRQRSTNPAFFCRNCDARADAAADLCNPQALSSKT